MSFIAMFFMRSFSIKFSIEILFYFVFKFILPFCCFYCKISSIFILLQSECFLSQNKTELNDMAVECLFKILEKMDFHDLLEMAQTSHYFKILARDVFRRKLSSKTVSIVAEFTKGPRQPIRESSSLIAFENYENTELLFRNFGTEIKRIELKFRYVEPKQRSQIHQLIEKYCSRSLLSLTLNIVDKNTLEHFTVPFERVENVTIACELTPAKNDLRLNQIFPKLRRLNLNNINLHDSDVLNITFPHLQHVWLTISILSDIYSPIVDLFTRNPQIRDLTLIYCNSFDYIKLASEHLPNLESLQLNLEILGDDYTGPKIYFNNVKTVKMIWGEFDFTDAIGFDQLESLDLRCNNCVRFVTQFTNLTKLQLVQEEIEENDFLRLCGELPNLNELTITSLSNIDEQTILQLVNGCKNLRKLNVRLNYDDFFDAQNKRFSDN